MVLPKEVRDEFDTDTFEIETKRNEIVLKPKAGLRSLVGKYPQIDVEKFKKEHAEEWQNEHFA